MMRFDLTGAGMAVLLLTGCGGEKQVDLAGEAMGMRWRLQVVGEADGGEIRREVDDVLAAWDRAASIWREDSEVSKFNRRDDTEWMPVDVRLVQAVDLARHVALETQGALDVTLRPLVALWGFGPEREGGGEPDAATLEAARKRTGWDRLEWRQEPAALRKRAPDVEICVDAVVEGLAMDEIAARLRARGLNNWLLELGGEVLAAGRLDETTPWRVAVQAPGAATGKGLLELPLEDAALATSGTYRQRRESDHATHILDPKTGRPIQHGLVSVTVWHERAALADAYATALLVLGPEVGRWKAEALGLRVVWVVDEG
ncbi:MAG: FAD:protein FMN transferase [Verrucomicrobiales bacterium]|nr:FAD:protein FMN transferase [Verrucomicrobiales bacterium]